MSQLGWAYLVAIVGTAYAFGRVVFGHWRFGVYCAGLALVALAIFLHLASQAP